MKTFSARRLFLTLTTLAAGLGLTVLWQLGRDALQPVGLHTGWLSVIVFLLHTGARLPGGPLECLLWWGFVLVAVSGGFGLWLSRWLPPRLARSDESLVDERIPRLRRELEAEARTLVRQAEAETKSTTLADFYLRVLAPYLVRVPALLAPLAGDDAQHHHVVSELAALRRFLNPRELAISDQLGELLEAKRNLDFQLAGQRLLKRWLFTHIPLTYGLLVVVGAHVWLVLHYSHRL